MNKREPELEVTACYFVNGELELTWKDIKTGKTATLITKCSKEEGRAIAEVIMPCSGYRAIGKDRITALETENTTLRAALEPFAARGDFPDTISDSEIYRFGFTVKQLKQAAAALEEGNDEAK